MHGERLNYLNQMLEIDCYWCEETLDEPGALLFSPPDENDRVDKVHLCVKCFNEIWLIIID